MELDDLKTAWQEMERRLEKSENLNLQFFNERRLDKVKSALRWFGWAQAIELAVWFALVVIVAPFWIEHRETAHFLVSGLVLHAYGVAAICLGTVQLLMIGRIRFSRPVLVIQKHVAELRRMRSRSTLLLGLPWCFLWVPLLIVGAKWLWDIDVYSPGWTPASLAFGLAVMLLAIGYARRQLHRPAGPEWSQRILDHLAGCSLNRAQQQIDAVARFARD
ncbi:MAG: hypothetical protein ACREQ8_00545 [Woeseiaceae bacterium]